MLQQIIAQAQAKNLPTGESFATCELMEDTVSREEVSISENNIVIDALSITAESYMILADTCFAAARQGGFSENEINAIAAGVKGTGAIIGDNVDMPSGESFEVAGGRVDATMLTGESIKDRAMNLYKTIKEFIMRQVNNLKELWKTHFSKLGRMKKQIVAAQTQYAKVEGTASKNKFKINLKAIFDGNNVAKATKIKSEAQTLKAFASELSSKTASVKGIVTLLSSGKFADVSAQLSAAKVVPAISGKNASDTQVKQAGMQEGYLEVKVLDDLLNGDAIFIGTPKEESAKGPRSKWIAGQIDDKVGNIEFTTLSSKDISDYLDAAAAQRDTADALTVAISAYTDAMADLSKGLDKAEKADDSEKEAAKKAATKIKDYTSIASDGVRGLIGHCVSAASTSYNYALGSAKLYKKES